MCGPHRRFAPLLPRTLRRIPQAVSTVATRYADRVINLSEVSIPQAVSTVATGVFLCALLVNRVSIPQAVSTVATLQDRNY